MVLHRDRAAHIAAGIQPCRWGCLPDRSDRSPGVVDVRTLEQRPHGRFEPVRRDLHIVVREHDNGGARRIHAGIEGVRLTLTTLEQIPQRHPIAGGAALHDVAGIVRRIVVDDEDVPAEAGIRGRPADAVQRRREIARAVVSADQDGRVDDRRTGSLDRRHTRIERAVGLVLGHHAPGTAGATWARRARESQNRWRMMPAKKHNHNSCSNARTRSRRSEKSSQLRAARSAFRYR